VSITPSHGILCPRVPIRKEKIGAFSIDKVYKRLANGVEDNTVTYFDISIEQLKGKCELPSGRVLYIKGDKSRGHTIM
jgi:hypothetical protein